MRICGIKLTHDGAVALIEDGRVVFCVEQEKLNNKSALSNHRQPGCRC
ncbi:putative NodU family carbamoyl transferase [Bradyrhizobium sp. LM3.6]